MAARTQPPSGERTADGRVLRRRGIERHELSLRGEQHVDALQRRARAHGDRQIGAFVGYDAGAVTRASKSISAGAWRKAHSVQRVAADDRNFLRRGRIAPTSAHASGLSSRARPAPSPSSARGRHFGAARAAGKIFSGLSRRRGSKTSRTRAIVARSPAE